MFTVDEEYRIGLLEALGLEYIILSSEDGHVMWLSLDEVRDELPVLEREELVTPLVVQKIRHLLEALPLSSSVDEVVTKIREHKLEPLPWSTRFEVCSSTDCSYPIIHGCLMSSSGQLHDEPIKQLFDGIIEVLYLIEADRIGVPEGIHLLKQMVEAGLSINLKEMADRFNALPASQRNAYAEQASAAGKPWL